MRPTHRPFTVALLLAIATHIAHAGQPVCEVQSGETRTPVIELYTSEGCSSCPPADRWLSTLKGKPVVAQAFHVAYWDYIGWADRFASPAYTDRQRTIAADNHLRSIYTPQWVRNGRDWRDWNSLFSTSAGRSEAGANIHLERTDDNGATDQFVAQVTPKQAGSAWSAYWTITEHGHSSRVKAGENQGETLQHDFVVRQYTPVGRYQGHQRLRFAAPPAQPDHPRQINLVVSDGSTGEVLQAVSLACPKSS